MTPAYARALGILTLALASATACGGGSQDEGTSPTVPPGNTPVTNTPTEEGGAPFDATVVHEARFEVGRDDLARLQPGNNERVHAKLSFDGVVLEDVGLRLKGGFASQQPLSGKPGFSVDTDKFDDDGSLSGVTRFTLGNAINDPSFVTESLVYEVFRQAGIVAPRTALATVSVNGESYGLYVIREGYDKNFLVRTFADPDGNLYEAALGVDITSVEGMEPRTNEQRNDKSDLSRVAKVVANEPDDTFLEELGKHVDLDQLLTYWAVEAIVQHWDGYIRPNNYYVYHDPQSRKFVFLAHGADWSMLDPAYAVLAAPGEAASMAARLYEDSRFLDQLRVRVAEVLARDWQPERLTALADQLGALVRGTGLSGAHETIGLTFFEAELALRKAFIAQRAENVRAQLANE